jgi:hypothetical protein
MTPKQRRQQDIFKRKAKEISDRAKDFKGNISERERESLGEQMPSMIGMGPEDIKGSMSEAERRMMQDNMPEMKKGGMTKSQKKVGTVMKEFKSGKLKSGKSDKKVTNPKQAIAIALSEAGMSKKKMMGGMMSDGVSKKGMGIEKKMGGGMMSDGVANRGSGIEMKSKGGMVRGQGIAIRGTKFKGIF